MWAVLTKDVPTDKLDDVRYSIELPPEVPTMVKQHAKMAALGRFAESVPIGGATE